MLTAEEESIISRHNPGHGTAARILQAVRNEEARGRSPEDTWQEAQRILTGKPMAYYGDPDLDDTAECPYSLLFPKNSPEMDTVLAGIAYQQIRHQALSQSEKLLLRNDGYYGMTVKSAGTFWDDPSRSLDELQMSPSSARFLQHLLPAEGKMQMDVRERSAGHMENSSYSRY